VEVYETEEQQIEALKAWFKKRAKLLSVGLTLIALATSGVLYTRHHIKVTKEEASTLYQAMITAIEKEDKVTAKTKATRLGSEYASSVYGSIAKLYLAKAAVEDKKWDEAKVSLEWVMQHAKNIEFQELARLRLAKILFSEKKSEAALKLLEKSNKKEDLYVSLLQELKADILKTQDKRSEAHALYKQAMAAILKKELSNPLLKIKVEDLGEG
jgi:predicted negative regulator of RcsB-dependent stress response